MQCLVPSVLPQTEARAAGIFSFTLTASLMVMADKCKAAIILKDAASGSLVTVPVRGRVLLRYQFVGGWKEKRLYSTSGA
uniref:Uncharacterized protein n=1 Tax=Arundo donax TaxID=35708 RepID=A0A0A8ZH73_ARUDO